VDTLAISQSARTIPWGSSNLRSMTGLNLVNYRLIDFENWQQSPYSVLELTAMGRRLMKRAITFCIFAYLIFILPASSFATVRVSLTPKDITWISVSPKTLGSYQVVIHIFGPSQRELARITGEHIGERIEVYLFDKLIVRTIAKVKINSGYVGAGRYETMNDAISRITEILTILEASDR
jgi:hypothetical protein